MVSHQPLKFGDHRQNGNGNVMVSVVEEQNSI